MHNDDRYAILQQDGYYLGHGIVTDIAPVIAPLLDLHPSDVAHRLRYGSGIYFSGIDHAIAENIAAIFQSREIVTRIIPAAMIKTLPRPYRSSRARLEASALILGVKGQQVVPWNEIWILGCGAIICQDRQQQLWENKEFKMILEIKDQQDRRLLKNSILDKVSEITLSEEELAHTPVYLDMISLQDWRRYRISRREFCYDILGNSAKVASKANFYQLLELITNRAPQAILTKSTQAFINAAGEITSQMFFDSEQNFSGYLRWYCLQQMLDAFVAVTDTEMP